MIDGDDSLDAEPTEPPPPGGSPCPDDASLSLYIDGRLDDAAGGRIRAHLDRCDDCRELVATAVQAHLALTAGSPAPAAGAPTPALHGAYSAAVSHPGAHGRIPNWLWAAAAAAAVVLAVRLGGGRVTAPELQAVQAWQAIAQSVGQERSLEPRLSMLPDHAPLAPAMRGNGTAADFSRQALARRLSEEAEATQDAGARLQARHAAAIATLLSGDPPGAIRQLGQVAAAVSEPRMLAPVLADLSAARLANGQPSEALAAARDALRHDAASAAARFNEALALERAGQAEAADRAWRAVAADPNQGAPWQDEARRHLRSPDSR